MSAPGGLFAAKGTVAIAPAPRLRRLRSRGSSCRLGHAWLRRSAKNFISRPSMRATKAERRSGCIREGEYQNHKNAGPSCHRHAVSRRSRNSIVSLLCNGLRLIEQAPGDPGGAELLVQLTAVRCPDLRIKGHCYFQSRSKRLWLGYVLA
jgi:hypothetical protein